MGQTSHHRPPTYIRFNSRFFYFDFLEAGSEMTAPKLSTPICIFCNS
jgi:hypothetical protein